MSCQVVQDYGGGENEIGMRTCWCDSMYPGSGIECLVRSRLLDTLHISSKGHRRMIAGVLDSRTFSGAVSPGLSCLDKTMSCSVCFILLRDGDGVDGDARYGGDCELRCRPYRAFFT